MRNITLLSSLVLLYFLPLGSLNAQCLLEIDVTNTTDESVAGASDGVVEFTASNSNGPPSNGDFSLGVYDANGNSMGTAIPSMGVFTLSGLPAGTYTISMTDSAIAGCTITEN